MVKSKTTLKRVLLLFLVFFPSARGFCAGQYDSIQLKPISLSAQVECNRIIYESSEDYKHSIFYLPRPSLGKGPEGGETYFISPGVIKDQFTLVVNLYFPTNDDLIQTSSGSTQIRDFQPCVWSKILYNLNQIDPSRNLKQAVMLPLSQIEVTIPNVKAVGRYGQISTQTGRSKDIDYKGKSISFEFQITQEEKKIFEQRLLSANGLQANVTFHFQGTGKSSTVSAKINTENFETHFRANAEAKKIKMLGSAEISLLVANSLKTRDITITSANNGEDNIEKVLQSVIEKMIADFSSNSNRNGPETENNGRRESDLKPKNHSGLISIDAFLQNMRVVSKNDFKVVLLAKTETASAETPITLKATVLSNPDIVMSRISAGYNDPSVGITLQKGETIAITPSGYKIDEISYKDVFTSLPRQELLAFNPHQKWSQFFDSSFQVADRVSNDLLFAEGKSTLMGVTVSVWRWNRIQRYPIRKQVESNVYDPHQSNFDSLPLQLTFSKLGDRRQFKFSELTVDNPFWSGFYDLHSGRMFITALQDLGTIRLREKMIKSVEYDDIVLDEIQQVKIGFRKQETDPDSLILRRDPRAIVKQKTIFVSFSRPRKIPKSEIEAIKNGVPTSVTEKLN